MTCLHDWNGRRIKELLAGFQTLIDHFPAVKASEGGLARPMGARVRIVFVYISLCLGATLAQTSAFEGFRWATTLSHQRGGTRILLSETDHRYKLHDPIKLYANKVGPFGNPRYGHTTCASILCTDNASAPYGGHLGLWMSASDGISEHYCLGSRDTSVESRGPEWHMTVFVPSLWGRDRLAHCDAWRVACRQTIMHIFVFEMISSS